MCKNASHEMKTPISFCESTQYLEMIEGHNISMESKKTLQQNENGSTIYATTHRIYAIDTNEK